ncbi:MAG: ABC transporter ATP-binding protein [Candidatus Onthoplasma sp.]
MKNLLAYMKKYKFFVIVGPLFKLAEAIMELFNPILVAKIIDEGVTQASIPIITKYGILIVVMNVASLICAIIGQKCSSLASTKISKDMRKDVFDKVASFSHTELDKFGTPSLVNRLTNDINQIESSVGVFIRTLLRTPFLLIGAFVMSLLINKKMSLIFLVLIPIVSLILWFYMKKTAPFYDTIRVKLDKISNVTKENLEGTRVIRAFNKQDFEQDRFEEVCADYTKTSIHVAKISALLEPVVFLIVDAATIALLAIGGWQINVGGMTSGNVIALIDYVSIITISLLLLSQIIAMFVRTNASLKRVNEIIATEPAIQENGVKKLSPKSTDKILEFDNVSFNYTQNIKDKAFIKDLSFSVAPHQTIGIIGGTGSGKTTIASLMTRFYDVTQGEIRYKGRNIKEYSLKQLRDEISIVQQRSTLFSGSLRENMKIRKNDATDEEIVEALKISQAWSFVSEWPNGLDYQIMAGGKNVSGGQMQRLTIARAIIGNPELLILDDSSSALDFLTDSNLRKALKKLDSTIVYISQRATSIKNADLIIVLDNGDVVGMGKHNELMKNCEIYKEIYESQSK